MADLNNSETESGLKPNQVDASVELDCTDLSYEQVQRILAWNNACIAAALNKLDKQ